jgi:PIN domain nuclease of toxin-antitoxin system
VARFLLDTHAFLWWTGDLTPITRLARDTIGDPANEIFVTAASAWEIATKFRIGKLPEAAIVADDIAAAIARQRFVELPVTVTHAQRAGALAGPLRDPFDRMLIAQSIIEGMPLVSNERAFDRYGVTRLW